MAEQFHIYANERTEGQTTESDRLANIRFDAGKGLPVNVQNAVNGWNTQISAEAFARSVEANHADIALAVQDWPDGAGEYSDEANLWWLCDENGNVLDSTWTDEDYAATFTKPASI